MKAGEAKRQLFEAASRLFLERGYAQVSVNDIVEAAEVHKTTFYRAFPSKQALGAEYLELLRDLFQRNLEAIARKSAGMEEFLRGWAGYWLHLFDARQFDGCPLANFRGYLPTENLSGFHDQVGDVLAGYVKTLQRIIAGFQQSSDLSAEINSSSLAEELFIVYEGTVFLAKATRSRSCLQRGEAMLLRVWEHHRSGG